MKKYSFLLLLIILLIPIKVNASNYEVKINGSSYVKSNSLIELTLNVSGESFYSAYIDYDISEYLSIENIEPLNNTTYTINNNRINIYSKTKLNSNSDILKITLRSSNVSDVKALFSITNSGVSIDGTDYSLSNTINKELIIMNQLGVGDAYLKSLFASNYDIEFDSKIYEYELEVSSKTNKLNLDVVPNDEESTYKILNNNLEVGMNYVYVRVTSLDGNEELYTIKVNKLPEENVVVNNNINKTPAWVVLTILLGAIVIFENGYILYEKIQERKELNNL